MQRPNVPPRTPHPMNSGGYIYAVSYPTEHYQYKDYNSPVIISPQQPVAGQTLPYAAVPGFRWDYSYKPAAVYRHPLTPQPMAHPAPQKKVLDIIDPNTGEKVDLSKVGTASKSNDPTKEQIRAQFASKVAAVATPKKVEVEDKVSECVGGHENGSMAISKEVVMKIEPKTEVESVFQSTPKSEEVKTVDPKNAEKINEERFPVKVEAAIVKMPAQLPMETQTSKEAVPAVDKSVVPENFEPIKDSKLSSEEAKEDNSDSEWKETKRNKKKKKATKPEPQVPPKAGNSQQQQHRQPKPITNGVTSGATSAAPARDQPPQPTPPHRLEATQRDTQVRDQPPQPVQQQHIEVTQKETQVRAAPAPSKPVPVWPTIKSNLVPSSQSQAAKPPAVPPQQASKPPQLPKQSQQGNKPQPQQPAVKQQPAAPQINAKQQQPQPAGKQQQQLLNLVNKNNDEQVPKNAGKRKSKEKNRNKKIADSQKPKSPEPAKVDEVAPVVVKQPAAVGLSKEEMPAPSSETSVENVIVESKSDEIVVPEQKPKEEPKSQETVMATFVEERDAPRYISEFNEVDMVVRDSASDAIQEMVDAAKDEKVVSSDSATEVEESVTEKSEITSPEVKPISAEEPAPSTEVAPAVKSDEKMEFEASVVETAASVVEPPVSAMEPTAPAVKSCMSVVESVALEPTVAVTIPEILLQEETLKEKPATLPTAAEYELEDGEIIDDDDDNISGEDAEKAMLMKFKYSENQWSPLNPEGSKKYGRDFLLQIQEAIKLNRPALPDLDIVLKEPHMRHVAAGASGAAAPVDFGGYVRQNSNSYGSSRGPNRGPNKGYDMRKVIEHRLNDNVVLHKSDSAWHRGTQRDEIDKVMATMKSILNKLTPQNFEGLMDQVKELNIDCEGKLAGCIGLIFEQCIRQPIYSGLYAKMAKCFSLLTVQSDENPEKTITFRKILLTKCQQEFEQDKENEREILAISELIENAEKDDERKLLEDKKEQAMMNAKRRSLGNIRFIGELYKLNMLTEVIMHECLSKLLSRYDDEDNIECLCKLLTTIGKELDNPKSKYQPRVEFYFGEMRRLVDEKKTSTRIRFMMMDVADLRKHGWVQKHNEGPKTIEQIHKEVEKEKMEVQKRIEDTPINRGARRQNSRHSNVTSASVEDGWTNVSRPPKSQAFDASKIKLTRMEDNIQLGPGRNSWNKGSTGGAPKELQQSMPSNRYSLLSNSAEEPPRQYGNSSKERERYTGRNSGFSSYKNDRTPSADRSLDVRPNAPTAGVEIRKDVNLELPKEEMETKVKSRIEEYLTNKDLKEAEETVKELKTDVCFKNAVYYFYYSIEQYLEKSSKIREEVGQLHLHILKNRIAPVAAYAVALRKLSKVADDLAVDVPQVWKYLGEIVSPVFLDGSNFKLNVLIAEPASLAEDSDDELESDDNDSTARLLAEVLNGVSQKKGHHQASELWESSKMKWDAFVKLQPVPDFLKRFKVDYTVQSSEAGRRRQRLESVSEDKNELIALFSKPDTTIEDIYDWIFENWGLPGQDSSTPAKLKHVSDCCTALCMSCLHKRQDTSLNEYDLDEERMKKFLCVIKSLTVDKQDRQLEVLFGLQELFHRLSYPKDLLHRLFELLFDAEVLNETAFHQWKEDNTRTIGKGVAVSSVSRFYSWILEEEKDQSEDN